MVDVPWSRVREFATWEAFYCWLAARHSSEDEVWIKIHKVRSGLTSIDPKEAIEVALCWGWIDGIRIAFDDQSFLHRYSQRGARSNWSRINADTVHKLTQSGYMTKAGLRAARIGFANGRWPGVVPAPAELPRSVSGTESAA
jgi:uncharacterized protein YdeI (YjbR/CyaY-like superfamily)